MHQVVTLGDYNNQEHSVRAKNLELVAAVSAAGGTSGATSGGATSGGVAVTSIDMPSMPSMPSVADPEV